MKKPKVAFASIPARAIGDERLTPLHWRVLAAISYHDRLSGKRGKGAGCYASNDKLAHLERCAYGSLSRALKELGAFGYIAQEAHPLNRRLRILRVLYSDADFQFVVSRPPRVNREAPQSAQTVNRLEKKPEPNQSGDPVQYIPLSGEHISLSEEINSIERAPIGIGASNLNEYAELKILERDIRGKGFITPEQTNRLFEIVQDVDLSSYPLPPDGFLAERLLHEFVGEGWYEVMNGLPPFTVQRRD